MDIPYGIFKTFIRILHTVFRILKWSDDTKTYSWTQSKKRLFRPDGYFFFFFFFFNRVLMTFRLFYIHKRHWGSGLSPPKDYILGASSWDYKWPVRVSLWTKGWPARVSLWTEGVIDVFNRRCLISLLTAGFFIVFEPKVLPKVSL